MFCKASLIQPGPPTTFPLVCRTSLSGPPPLLSTNPNSWRFLTHSHSLPCLSLFSSLPFTHLPAVYPIFLYPSHTPSHPPYSITSYLSHFHTVSSPPSPLRPALCPIFLYFSHFQYHPFLSLFPSHTLYSISPYLSLPPSFLSPSPLHTDSIPSLPIPPHFRTFFLPFNTYVLRKLSPILYPSPNTISHPLTLCLYLTSLLSNSSLFLSLTLFHLTLSFS